MTDYFEEIKKVAKRNNWIIKITYYPDGDDITFSITSSTPVENRFSEVRSHEGDLKNIYDKIIDHENKI
jgi:hypothetical protein